MCSYQRWRGAELWECLDFNFLQVNFEVFVGHKHYFLRRNFVLAPVPEAP
jgi:hypothetical protein